MESQKTPSEAQRFVRALESDKKLRQEALSIPRQHLLKLAEQRGYKLTGQELYEEMRQEWATEVPADGCAKATIRTCPLRLFRITESDAGVDAMDPKESRTIRSSPARPRGDGKVFLAHEAASTARSR